MRAMTLALLATAAACNSFENPEVVIDFRVLAMTAEPPEQVIDVDINQPQPPAELLEQVAPTEVCVLLSDREYERRLRWEMRVCLFDNDVRCDVDHPIYSIGTGIWDDPEASATSPRLCDTIQPDGNLLGVAVASFESDQLRGLGGLYYGVQLIVGGEGEDPALDLYAAKSLRLMPRIPAEVTANSNPTLESLEVIREGEEPMTVPFGRCRDVAAPVEVAVGSLTRLTPVEAEGVRETYASPTLDGGFRTFTESLTYQWLATAGNYTSSTTGGTRDAFGNDAPLFTDWRAPREIDGPTDVDLWIIQRDERLGVSWREACLRVVP